MKSITKIALLFLALLFATSGADASISITNGGGAGTCSPATTGTLGCVIPDGTTIAVGTSGVISSVGGGGGVVPGSAGLNQLGIVNSNGTFTAFQADGDDLTTSSDSGGSLTRYVNLIQANSPGSVLTVNAATNNQACDVSNYAVNLQNPPATNSPPYGIMVGMNDANNAGAGAYEANFNNCLNATASYLAIPITSKVIINSSNCTQTGTGWGNGSIAAGTVQYTNTNGNTDTCTITTNGGPLYFWYALDTTKAAAQMAWSVDSGAKTGTVFANPSPSIATANGHSGMGVAIITGLSAGSHTFALTTGGSNYSLPYAIGTPPASITAGGPHVFVAGVPFQQSNGASTATAAYNTDVATDVAALAGAGLPVYLANVRGAAPVALNSSTDMADQLHLTPAGQVKVANTFLQSMAPYYSTANNVVGQASGGTGSPTSQGALTNLFTTGTLSAAPIVPACTGGSGDAAAMQAAIPIAAAAHTSILTPSCVITGQVQGTYGNTYAFFYGQSNDWADLSNGDATTPNLIKVNTANITNTPGSAAIDMHGVVNMSFKDIAVNGTSNGVPATFISVSTPSPAGPANNTISYNNVGMGNMQTGMGAASDDSYSSLNAGGISSANSTIVAGTGYTTGNYEVIPLTGGSGSGATATFVAVGTTGIPTVSNIAGGVNYHVGDVLGIGTSVIGGGSGFSLTVNKVFGTGAISRVNPNGSGATPGTITAAGTLYTPGTYSNVPLTGGNGSGAVATTIVVGGGGTVTSVTLPTLTGANYYVGDVLSASAANIGGTGSGFTYTVSNLQPASGQTYTLPHSTNTVTGNYGCGICGEYTDLYAWGNDYGGGGAGIFGGGANVLAGGTTGAGGASQVWNNRFEYEGGFWSFGGFDTVSNNVFTGPNGNLFNMLLAGTNNHVVDGNDFDSPALWSNVQIGMPRLNGAIGSNAGMAFVGNAMYGTGAAHGCVDFEGSGDDYINMEGNTCYSTSTSIPSVYFGTEHPAHAAYSFVGQQGFWAWLGMPMGIGTDTPVATTVATLDVRGTSAIHVPQGTTGQRPGSPVEGLLRDNTTLSNFETYVNSAWVPLAGLWSSGTPIVASGCGSIGSLTGGKVTFSFTAGQTSCIPIITLPTAPNGWRCVANDLTNPSDAFTQTASSATSCTLSATVTNGDTVLLHAEGF